MNDKSQTSLDGIGRCNCMQFSSPTYKIICEGYTLSSLLNKQNTVYVLVRSDDQEASTQRYIATLAFPRGTGSIGDRKSFYVGFHKYPKLDSGKSRVFRKSYAARKFPVPADLD